jgi:hypothetical protein
LPVKSGGVGGILALLFRKRAKRGRFAYTSQTSAPPALFFNGVLATIMGVGVVCLIHALTFPTDTAWKRRLAERRPIQRIVRALQQSRMIPVGYLGSVARTLNDCLLLGGDTVEGDPGQADSLINLWALGYEVITFERGGEDMTGRAVKLQT